MANISHYREILLLTTTSFAKRDLCEIEPLESPIAESSAEKMVRACWNGLLAELLPELVYSSTSKENLYLLDVCKLNSSLLIQMNTIPGKIKLHCSINPGLIQLQGIYN